MNHLTLRLCEEKTTEARRHGVFGSLFSQVSSKTKKALYWLIFLRLCEKQDD